MVKALIDENISPKTQKYLAELGFDVLILKHEGSVMRK